jgi:ABC-type nickel/cobalt efflux system permease component RcnA
MDLAVVLALEVLNGIASLVLISVGLAIIFGMMRVINLGHGEFLMLGGYAAIVATSRGVNIWIAMLVVAPIVVGIIGVIAERLIIRVLYGRMIDTLLATWGLSLFFVGLVTTIFGNTVARHRRAARQRRGRALQHQPVPPGAGRHRGGDSSDDLRRAAHDGGSACWPAARWNANMAAALGVESPARGTPPPSASGPP